jgi:hypothetical protein
MIDGRAEAEPGSGVLVVSPTVVLAAKLQVKRAKERGTAIDPAIEAIANARPMPTPNPSSQVLVVSSTVAAAAKLQVKRAKERGNAIDPAIEAIANARPMPTPSEGAAASDRDS